MPRMNGAGPEGKGPKSGRGMGRCKKEPGKEDLSQPGRGQGSRRKSEGGAGRGRRMGVDQPGTKRRYRS